MEGLNLGKRCIFHMRVMWLVLAATLSICVSFPTHEQKSVEGQGSNSTAVDHVTPPLLNIEAKSPKYESTNSTHSSVDDSTPIEFNGTYQNTDVSNNFDDLLEVTSSLRNHVCALCTVLEYNSTEAISPKGNSSSFLLSTPSSSPEGASNFNIGIIAGIVALVIVIITLLTVLGFFAYKRFYPTLCSNRPQTLTDKFSNDESTGYIDDTAFRENSEEMYSLDNDSFLNSLEAMTIQNYWTDHVRHTKL